MGQSAGSLVDHHQRSAFTTSHSITVTIITFLYCPTGKAVPQYQTVLASQRCTAGYPASLYAQDKHS